MSEMVMGFGNRGNAQATLAGDAVGTATKHRRSVAHAHSPCLETGSQPE